jgi:hypothetical protein
MSNRGKSNAGVQRRNQIQEEKNMKSNVSKHVPAELVRTFTATNEEYNILLIASLVPIATLAEIGQQATARRPVVQSLIDRGFLFNRPDYPDLVSITEDGSAMKKVLFHLSFTEKRAANSKPSRAGDQA